MNPGVYGWRKGKTRVWRVLVVSVSIALEVCWEVVPWSFPVASMASHLIPIDGASWWCITCPGLGLIVNLDLVRLVGWILMTQIVGCVLFCKARVSTSVEMAKYVNGDYNWESDKWIRTYLCSAKKWVFIGLYLVTLSHQSFSCHVS